ncbi:MAG: glycosyltransferase, partial [Candidatus Omnitrophica bacterium]|nr:glycosyltransferase [Candidatus Omnitrophota bacterium]
AISDNVRNRIKRFYERDAEIIYPPAETNRFESSAKDEGFYLIISALVPYKRIDLAVEAFNASGKRLIVIGTGNSEKRLKSIARANIEFLGWVDDKDIADYYYRCTALIFPGEEDFGIVPVEANACGKPVIAYGKGGVLETIIPANPPAHQPVNSQPTGVFFYEQTPKALIEAVEYFEGNKDKFNPDTLRENALRFDRGVFKQRISEFIKSKVKKNET